MMSTRNLIAAMFAVGLVVTIGGIAGTDGTGVTRTVYANIEPGNKIDLAHAPIETPISRRINSVYNRVIR